MSVHVLFKSVSTLTPTLTSIVYEGNNYGAFLVQSSASVWDLYIQKSSEYDTIALTSWHTSHTMADRVAIDFPGTLQPSVPEPFYRATPAKTRSLLDHIYPVGSIYLAYNHTSPASLFGGTWTRINNRFLWACDEFGVIGAQGGEANHTLTVEELPSHNHGSYYSGFPGIEDDSGAATKQYAWYTTAGSNVAYGWLDTGGGKSHNNMPPYIHIAAWRRTE